MATVYVALDVKHHRTVALKVLRGDLSAAVGAERFLREIEIAARLQHPNILPLYDSGTTEGFLYYVMPCVEGGTLRQRLEQDGQLPIEEALRITRDVAEGLSYAHGQGVIHRDIKPENILLQGSVAMVADFGIARVVSAAEEDARITGSGFAVGTPLYMSPEQAAGTEILKPASDVYSLACVLYEMLVGEPPFLGRSSHAIRSRHATEPVPSIRQVRETVPPGLEAAIRKALAKTPADRFPTVRQFIDAIEGAAGPLAFSGPYAISGPHPTPGRWIRLWLALAAVALAVLVGALVFRRPSLRVGSVAEDIPMLAVLPFDNLGSPGDAYLAEGISDEITSRIAEFSRLGVISRASALRYSQRDKMTEEIGRELGADYLLVGSVQTERRPDGSGTLRVIPHLIRVKDDREIWTDRFTGMLMPGELFTVQSVIAQGVAEALNVSLQPAERLGLRARPTENPDAYDAYLRGVTYSQRRFAEEPSRLAIEHFQRAVHLDPRFALAWAKLAEAHTLYYAFFDRSQARLTEARQAVDRALALDPSLVEARLAEGYVYYWGYQDFERAFGILSELRREQPNNSELWWVLGSLQRQAGRLDEALASTQRALQLNPRSETYAVEVGANLQMLGRYKAADSLYARAIA
ncbi:MAG: protein kinase domain-containing protein, partial [Gemmatimonadota bacterium]